MSCNIITEKFIKNLRIIIILDKFLNKLYINSSIVCLTSVVYPEGAVAPVIKLNGGPRAWNFITIHQMCIKIFV